MEYEFDSVNIGNITIEDSKTKGAVDLGVKLNLRGIDTADANLLLRVKAAKKCRVIFVAEGIQGEFADYERTGGVPGVAATARSLTPEDAERIAAEVADELNDSDPEFISEEYDAHGDPTDPNYDGPDRPVTEVTPDPWEETASRLETMADSLPTNQTTDSLAQFDDDDSPVDSDGFRSFDAGDITPPKGKATKAKSPKREPINASA